MVLISVAWALVCVPMLEISTDAGQARQVALAPDARFSVTYWHSMYDAPLTEDFVVTAERRIHLIKVRSRSGAVLEYLGISAAGDEHPMDRQFSSLSFLVATKEPQTLIVGERTWSFRDFGPPGARIEFNGGVDCANGTQKSPR